MPRSCRFCREYLHSVRTEIERCQNLARRESAEDQYDAGVMSNLGDFRQEPRRDQELRSGVYGELGLLRSENRSDPEQRPWFGRRRIGKVPFDFRRREGELNRSDAAIDKCCSERTGVGNRWSTNDGHGSIFCESPNHLRHCISLLRIMQYALQNWYTHTTVRVVKTPRIACIGEALVVFVPEREGALEDAETFRRTVGGAELNVALGLAHAGVDVALLTRIGDDGFGRHLAAFVGQHGVDVSGIDTDDSRPTGIYFKESGGDSTRPTDLGRGNSRMHYFRTGSASSAFATDYLRSDVVANLLENADLVHTTGITVALSASSQKMVLELASRPRAGKLLSFDVNWRPQLWKGREGEGARVLSLVASLSDIVLLGASEGSIVYGTSDPHELRRLIPGPRWLVVKNDGNAATAFDGDRRVDVDAIPTTVIEAIGAGDAFAAGFLASLVRGRPLEENLMDAHRLAVVALVSRADHVGSR